MCSALIRTESLPVFLDDLWFKFRRIDLVRGDGLPQQLLDSYALIVVRTGMGQLMVDLQEYGLRGQTVYIIRPGQTLGAEFGAYSNLEMYVIHFDIYQDSGAFDSFPLKGEVPVGSGDQLLELCDLMLLSSQSACELERFRGQSAFQELLYRILKNFRTEQDNEGLGTLERTKLYIDQYYAEALSVHQLSQMAGLSPKYYGELFKKTYGISVMDYIAQTRVNSAKKLMLQSNARLADIAHQVGFNDEFYFSRKFKKETGVCPTAYLKNRRRRIAAYMSPVLGFLLPLNMMPFAAPLHPKWTAYYHKMYRSDIPLHLSAYRYNQDWEANVDALMNSAPDLIIALDILRPEEQAKLEQAAELALIDSMSDWRTQFRQVACLVEAEQEAEAWLRAYEWKARSAREQLSRRIGDERLMVLSLHKDELINCPARAVGEVIRDDLQLNVTVPTRSLEHRQDTILVSELMESDPDWILLNVRQESETLAYWEMLKASTQWRDLKAVRKNQAHMIHSDPWREYSAYACKRMLDDLLYHISGDRPD
ncbi:AraC family transcriptional regulator [Paenibacillus tuaregi]|uniref:AraC family transcriptional regulator n=1 Tax=Paenibacillus tuaregi TaxID=1816681 RepID=UPI0008380ADA|nr:AraC family transcriptional regulator [Paenibacillus tuaregi]